jgi:hypothetical protein
MESSTSKDGLHPDHLNVVLGIHPVFQKLDDGQQQTGVPKPGEDIVNGAKVLIRQASSTPPVKMGQHNDGDLGITGFHLPGHLKRIDLAHIQHGHDQVKALSFKSSNASSEELAWVN